MNIIPAIRHALLGQAARPRTVWHHLCGCFHLASSQKHGAERNWVNLHPGYGGQCRPMKVPKMQKSNQKGPRATTISPVEML